MFTKPSNDERIAFVVFKSSTDIIIIYMSKDENGNRKQVGCVYSKGTKGFYNYMSGGSCEFKVVKASKASVTFHVRQPLVVTTKSAMETMSKIIKSTK